MKVTAEATRRGAFPAALVAGLLALALDPFSWGKVGTLGLGIAAGVVIVLIAAWGMVALGANAMPEISLPTYLFNIGSAIGSAPLECRNAKWVTFRERRFASRFSRHELS